MSNLRYKEFIGAETTHNGVKGALYQTEVYKGGEIYRIDFAFVPFSPDDLDNKLAYWYLIQTDQGIERVEGRAGKLEG